MGGQQLAQRIDRSAGVDGTQRISDRKRTAEIKTKLSLGFAGGKRQRIDRRRIGLSGSGPFQRGARFTAELRIAFKSAQPRLCCGNRSRGQRLGSLLRDSLQLAGFDT